MNFDRTQIKDRDSQPESEFCLQRRVNICNILLSIANIADDQNDADSISKELNCSEFELLNLSSSESELQRRPFANATESSVFDSRAGSEVLVKNSE